MSIKKIAEKDGKMTLEFDNGDLKGFSEIMEKWNFKDEQSLIRFVMGAMLTTTDKTLTITTDSGDEKIVPPQTFLK